MAIAVGQELTNVFRHCPDEVLQILMVLSREPVATYCPGVLFLSEACLANLEKLKGRLTHGAYLNRC